MSATATLPAKMSGPDAHGLLMREIFAPAFMDKLAQHGIVPQTQEEATHCLSMGQKLLVADQYEQTKKASTRVDQLKQAEADLDREFKRRYGHSPAGVASPDDDYVKKASAYLGRMPAIQQAVADYNEAVEAEQGR